MTRIPSLVAALVLGVACLAITGTAQAQSPLLTAQDFAVLAGSTVTNTGSSVLNGDLGVSPGSACTGFVAGTGCTLGPGIVNGTVHLADGVASQAQIDLTAAYTALAGQPIGTDLTGQDLGTVGLVTPGVYGFDTTAGLTGTLTLSGKGQYIFNIGTDLTTASASSVVLANGAKGGNVFWLLGTSTTDGSATLGTSTSFVGNILALQSITLTTGATIICGAALAQIAAVTLDSNVITTCVAGGGDDINDIPRDELGGEGVSGTQQTAFDASRLFGATMLAQTVFPAPSVGAPAGPQATGPEKYTPLKLGPSSVPVGGDFYQPQRWRIWAAGLGGGSSLDGDRGSGTLDTTVGGVAGGLDYRFNPTALIGIAGGYTDSELSVDQLHTDGTVQGAHVGLYGVKSFGRIYLAGTAEYAHFENDTDRIIDFVVDERARGNFNSDSFGGRLEAGWRASWGRHYITPFVGVDAYQLDIDGFTETSQNLNGGPGILGLTFASDTVNSVTSSVGIQFDTTYALANDRWLTPFVRVAWVHEYDPERGVQSFLTGSPAASFLVDGASAAEDVVRVVTGLRLDLSERIALWGFFEGDFGDGLQSYAGVGGGDVAFAGSGQGEYNGRLGMKVRW